MADEYPKAWLHLDTGSPPIAIGGESVPVFDPNVAFVVVVLCPGGRQMIARQTHDKLGPTPQREDAVRKSEALGFLAEVPRADWPEWLVDRVNAALGPS